MSNDDSFRERMRNKFGIGARLAWAPSPPPLSAESPSIRPSHKLIRHGESLPTTRLGLHERGVVWTELPSDWVGRPGQILMNSSNPPVDHNAIRSALVFYDRFDVPSQPVVRLPSVNYEYLNKYGLAQRTAVKYEGDLYDVVTHHAFGAYLALDEREPGRWTLGRPTQMYGIPVDELSTQQGFSLTVNNALPIFTREVPMEEVLEFKLKRIDELRELRGYFDELSREIGVNGSNGFENTSTFEKFDRALANHMKVMQESNYSKITTSFRASISVDSLIPIATEAMLNQTISTTGIVSAMATVGVKTINGLRRKRGSNPFEYLTSVNHELR